MSGHVHDWHERQQGAGRYCPGCDTMEWFPMTPTPDALAALTDALHAWKWGRGHVRQPWEPPCSHGDEAAHVLETITAAGFALAPAQPAPTGLTCPSCAGVIGVWHTDGCALRSAQPAPTGLREALERLRPLSERSSGGEWDALRAKRVLDSYGKDPEAEFEFIAGCVNYVRAALASGSAGDAGEGAS